MRGKNGYRLVCVEIEELGVVYLCVWLLRKCEG